jgi:GDP-L-fucose synthase
LSWVFLSRKDGDLRDRDAVISLFEKYKPTMVVHLASHVGGVYDNMNNNYTYLMDNINTNCNIVEACKQFGVKRLVNILSTCIFPDLGVEYPLTSEQLHNGLPHFSNIGYAYSKRVLHVASKILSETTDTKVINIIPTNLYGKNDNYNLVSSHVIPAIIHKTYLAKYQHTPLEIKGSGKAIRQFLHAEDLARAIIEFLKLSFSNSEITCIVSPPESDEISIKNMVELVCKKFDYRGAVNCDLSCSDGQYKKTTTDTELKKWLPDFQFTPFESGLERAIDFFVKNYDTLRK